MRQKDLLFEMNGEEHKYMQIKECLSLLKFPDNINSLTRLIGHGRPGQKHSVQGDERRLQQT